MVQTEHLNTRVSCKTMGRIKAACGEREEIEGVKVTPGRIINELATKYLPPTADEELAAPPPTKKGPRPISGNGKGRAAKNPSAAA